MFFGLLNRRFYDTYILLHGEYDLSPENNYDEFAIADPKIVNLIHTRFWESKITN